ncbi:hypothetical protein EYC87_18635, partial [Halieaceae bacterium IMCC8485]|nr:hypothetical protein [Candidatus Seongchinamella marina]
MRFSVAFLLIWGCGFASCEKRQAGRGRPGWRYQEGRGRGFLFLALKMSQNSIDDVLVFDATARRSDDNSDRTTAAKDTTLMGVLWPLGSLITLVSSLDRNRWLSAVRCLYYINIES